MSSGDSSSTLYGDFVSSEYFLSIFTHGSEETQIQSRRWLMPVGTSGNETRWIRRWAIDLAQDLLVIVEMPMMDANARMNRYVFFL